MVKRRSRPQGRLLSPQQVRRHQLFVAQVGSALLVLGQRQFGTVLEEMLHHSLWAW